METALVIAAIVGGTASGITKVIGGIALWNRFFKKPKLELYTEVTQEGATGGKDGRRYICKITYGIVNNGRAIAKHVQLSLRVVHYGVDVEGGLDGNGNHGLPLVPSVDGFIKFASDANSVIHPKGRLPVAATRLWIPGASPNKIKDAVIIYEISAEGAKTVEGEQTITAAEMIKRVVPKIA
jgi:hypothetical protein